MSEQEDFIIYDEAPELDRICQQVKTEFSEIELIIKGCKRYSRLYGDSYCVQMRIRDSAGDHAKISLLDMDFPDKDYPEIVRFFIKKFVDERRARSENDEQRLRPRRGIRRVH
jgi:hypothetical protein